MHTLHPKQVPWQSLPTLSLPSSNPLSFFLDPPFVARTKQSVYNTSNILPCSQAVLRPPWSSITLQCEKEGRIISTKDAAIE